jgi:prolyl oligopeptidase
MRNICLAALLTALPCSYALAQEATQDEYIWLEDVTAEKSLDWAKAHNGKSTDELLGEEFSALEQRLLSIMDSDEKIPFVRKSGAYYYNLWTDAKNPRGLWRRTTPSEYAKDEPAWEVVLDLDALGQAEDESWVWHGAAFLEPENRLCLLSLSRGGSDADVVREFDTEKKAFIDGGFFVPEAKSSVSWRDENSLWVGTDFGPGSMTESGYARMVKLWKRGAPLEKAELSYEGKLEDVWVGAGHDATPGFERDFISRGITFWTNELLILRDDKWVKVEKPDDAKANLQREFLFLELRSDWSVGEETFAAGSLLVTRFEDHMAGKGTLEVLFTPSERISLAGYSPTRNHVLLTTLDNVRSKIPVLTHTEDGWTRGALEGLPAFGQLRARAIDSDESDEYFVTVTGFLTPSSLYTGAIGQGAPVKLKSTPAFFDASGLAVAQHEAISKDGTRIPYFEVRREDLQLDGKSPTLLYAYGGFEISMTPGYSATRGAAWLEQGGVFVLANIRGGGEFGPQWHQAALKENRPRAYEDLAAVAQDLIDRKVTSAARLGVMGGSNGGLLVGNMITMYPELFGAAVCQVPLLDMRRYHLLLAGASWMGEYGDPDDPEQWAYIETFSPYHNVTAEASYPRTMFMTSTRDDRVHPGHARKMVAKMEAQGHDVLYYENIEGGHGGAADNKQRAFMAALAYKVLWNELTDVGP